ncbi:MAG: beta-ketoacyl-[acyl-carrier-protein] synthase family protein [Desulfobulbaceae bacterium]
MGKEKRQAVITGCGALTALGDLDNTWDGLMAGRSGLRPTAIPGIPTVYPMGRVDLPGVGYGSARRLAMLLDHSIGRFAADAPLPPDCDLIVSTTKGAADELLDNPEDPRGQPWQLAEMIAGQAGCTGHLQTVSAACASGAIALIQAASRIIHGESASVLVVGVDLLSRFVTAGFDALKGMSETPCAPFDRERTGLSLGEGVGYLVVQEAQAARDAGRIPLAAVSGWGISCDATHITAPSRTADGLIRVIEQATAGGTIPVGAINAHGTGTVYNDAMELTAFRSCWPDGAPPVHSVKGALGHCLGAAGVIEAAIAVRSLREQVIPPCVGFHAGEDGANNISGTAPLPLAADTIFTCNSGFGGINAGIVLTQP